MKLYHATPTVNVANIRQLGLLASYARGTKVVWMHEGRLREWATLHVSQRWSVPLTEVSVITLRLARRSVIKTFANGLWRTPIEVDVPAWAILSVDPAAKVLPVINLCSNKGWQSDSLSH